MIEFLQTRFQNSFPFTVCEPVALNFRDVKRSINREAGYREMNTIDWTSDASTLSIDSTKDSVLSAGIE